MGWENKNSENWKCKCRQWLHSRWRFDTITNNFSRQISGCGWSQIVLMISQQTLSTSCTLIKVLQSLLILYFQLKQCHVVHEASHWTKAVDGVSVLTTSMMQPCWWISEISHNLINKRHLVACITSCLYYKHTLQLTHHYDSTRIAATLSLSLSISVSRFNIHVYRHNWQLPATGKVLWAPMNRDTKDNTRLGSGEVDSMDSCQLTQG